MKPASIKKFDLLYLGALAISIITMIINFDSTVAIANQSYVEQGIDPMGSVTVIAGIIITIVISLALWFLVSILQIEMIKWLLILFASFRV